MQVGDLISYNVGSGRKSLGLILDRSDIKKPWTIGSDSELFDCVLVFWCHINKLPAQLDMGKRMSKHAVAGDTRWYRSKTMSGFCTFAVLSSI